MGEAVLKTPAETKSARIEQKLEINVAQAEKLCALAGRLQELRSSATAHVNDLARPQSADELWRQTKPELFPWSRLKNISAPQIQAAAFADKKAQLPRGVSVTHGAEACSKFDRLLTEVLFDRSQLKQDWCAAVQLAALSAVTVVTVEAGTKQEGAVLLSTLISSDSACSSLLVLNVPADSVLRIIDDCSGDDAFFLNRIEAVIGPRAKLSFISAQRLGGKASYLARHNFHLDRDAVLESVYLNIGAQNSRIDLDLFMNQPGGSAELRAVTISDGKRHTDFHPTQHHLARHCRSDLFTKGIAKDSAHSVYYGYIRVAEGAQRTDAYQTNRNLVLSEKARADSIPNLEIKANDVKCSHGASVGHVNAEDMFYLMSRGLSRAASERLLVEGFIEDVLGQTKEPGAHDWLYDLVIARLDSK